MKTRTMLHTLTIPRNISNLQSTPSLQKVSALSSKRILATWQVNLNNKNTSVEVDMLPWLSLWVLAFNNWSWLLFGLQVGEAFGKQFLAYTFGLSKIICSDFGKVFINGFNMQYLGTSQWLKNILHTWIFAHFTGW